MLFSFSLEGWNMPMERAEQGWDVSFSLQSSAHETTRYLCAAAYSDTTFREEVLARSRETVRACAPEVGVDTTMINEHCRRANRSKAIRDLFICLPSIFLIMFGLAALGALDTEAMITATIQVIFFCWLTATVIIAVEAMRIDTIIRRELTREGFRERIGEAAVIDCHSNVVVYSGFSPFVGAGSDLGGWSFAIDLERGKQGVAKQDPRPFELDELYDHVSKVLEDLKFPNLRMKRKLFVSGLYVRSEPDFLRSIYDQPVDNVPDDVVTRFADNSSRQVRHYLSVEIVDWNGEIVISFFLRFQKISTKLFVELSAFLLPPLRIDYYNIDKVYPKRRFKDLWGVCIAAMFQAPFLLALAPLATLGRFRAMVTQRGERSRLHDLVKADQLFDYGAKASLREIAAGAEWRVYFQKLDKEMHHKILQQQLLDTLVDFLDEHGIDTSEIKERTTHILNNGVIVSGGSINAQGLAVGEGAQTMVAKAARRGREKVGA
jgi:hypothetical protein